MTVSTRPTERALLLGSGLALAGFILLPTFRAIVGALVGAVEIDYPTPRTAAAEGWWGIAGGAILLLIGAGVVTAALASDDRSTPGARFRTALGVLGGAGYGLAGAASRTMYSWIAGNLAETGADAGAQTAAMWTMNLVGGALLLFGIVATCGWVIGGGGVSGRAARAAASTLAAVIVVCAFGPLLLVAQFLFVPVFAIIAADSWRRRRALRDTAADA